MNINEITKEIQSKLNHVIDAKINAYINGLKDETEEYKELKISQFITELTFDISSKIIKERTSKINPKALEFTFYLNRTKYFEQTINELAAQVNKEVFFDSEAIKKHWTQIDDSEPFTIKFNGHFLKDNGYIGSKVMEPKNEILEKWFPAILSCMQVNATDSESTEDKLNFLRDLVSFGFKKALEMEYVFIDVANMDKNLSAVDYVIVNNSKLTIDEFFRYRENNKLGSQKKSTLLN